MSFPEINACLNSLSAILLCYAYVLIRRREIEKHRYIATHDGETWEIDVYDGSFTGLVVAELEMDDPHRTFTIPACFGPTEEVTFWRGMKNVALSLDGFSDELKARLRAWYGHEVWTA